MRQTMSRPLRTAAVALSTAALAGGMFAAAPASADPSSALRAAKAAVPTDSTPSTVAAEWLAFLVPTVAVWFGWHSLFEEKMYAVWVLDFVFAYALGIVFQYYAIVPMRGLSPGEGVVAAVKADTASLIAWQVGMYGLMALVQFWLYPHLAGQRAPVNSVEFWFAMQVAMVAGFLTSYPVNWWLVGSGIKERM